MELYSPLLNGMHLDRTYRKTDNYYFKPTCTTCNITSKSIVIFAKSLLTVRNTTLLYEMFSLLDAHNLGELNDSQFGSFLRSTTPLKGDHIDTIFQMLDRQGHGGITWENFYLVVAILISLKAGLSDLTTN